MNTSIIPYRNHRSGAKAVVGELAFQGSQRLPGSLYLPLLLQAIPVPWINRNRSPRNHTTYSLLMFFKLKILIILCRPQKVFFEMYFSDNQLNIINTPSMNLYSKVMSYVGMAVIAMFFLFGLFILISPVFSYVPQNYRVFIAIFMMGYGLFRLIQMVQKIRKSKEEDL